jgi:hypothetical protein
MKDKDIIAQSEEISHPGFDRSKHHLLCSELKQLYVAITRTRQRLWICENTDDYCRPMFDYWKKLCLVEVRLLDSSLIQAMRTGSSTDDWKLRGINVCFWTFYFHEIYVPFFLSNNGFMHTSSELLFHLRNVYFL